MEATTRLTLDVPTPKLRLMRSLAKELGCTISRSKPARTKKLCELDEALEDIKAGRVYAAKDVDDMFKQILG